MLFWSHFKSAIEHFYIKIKKGFDHVFMDFMEVGAVKLVSALQLNIFTGRSKAVLLLWIICVISVLCLLCFRASVY